MNTQFDTAPSAAGSVISGREWRNQRALAMILRRLTPSWSPFPVNKLTPDAGIPPARRRAGPAALFMMQCVSSALAGAILPPGDAQLRSDIQLLSAWNIVTGPTSTWPIAWRQLEADLNAAVDPETFPSHVEQALSRVRLRMAQALQPEAFMLGSRAAVSGTTGVMRSFQSVPRDDAELSGRLRWLGDRLSVQIAATAVRDASDGRDARADGSMLGLTMGNTTVAVGVVDRWWGPGWDGSLILSSNARPFPAMTIDRNETTAFASRWLNWIGPWDMSVIAGRLESDRFVPGAQFLGLRLTARPARSLEVGLSRTALWCGTGRPCDFETFVDLFRGNDNRGDSGVSDINEPGNQLAGIDIRWSPAWFDRSFALYGQFIGEDEAGGLPSRYLGLLGVERRLLQAERDL